MKYLFTSLIIYLLSIQIVLADIAKGECGSCVWIIDDSQQMVIKPTDGNSGVLDNWVNILYLPWEQYRDQIVAVRIEGSVKAKTCAFMFYQCSRLRSADLKGLNTDEVSDWRLMFDGCSSIEQIDLSNMSFANATNINRLFKGCNKLSSLNLGNFKLGKLEKKSIEIKHKDARKKSLDVNYSYGSVFKDCNALKSITVTSQKPHKIHEDLFSSIPNLESCTLYVPERKTKKFRKAKGWSVFHEIRSNLS